MSYVPYFTQLRTRLCLQLLSVSSRVCGRLTIETSFSFLLCTVAAPEHNKHKALLMYLAMSANMEKKKYLYIIIHDKTLTGSIYKQEVYLISELLHAELVQDTEAIIPAHSSWVVLEAIFEYPGQHKFDNFLDLLLIWNQFYKKTRLPSLSSKMKTKTTILCLTWILER